MAIQQITKSGDANFTRNWNETVQTLAQLKKMKGDGCVNITWLAGVPTISGEKPGEAKVGIGKANGSISNRASGNISVWVGTFGSESDRGDDISMFNLGPAVVASDWVMWQVINDQYAFVKLCSS